MNPQLFSKILTVYLLVLSNSVLANILIMRPESKNFDEFVQSFETEVSHYYKAEQYVIAPETSTKEILQKIDATKPSLILLLDNVAVKKAKKLLEEHSKLPPMIATMALNLRHSLRDIDDIAGVGYEVSGYTIVSELNKIINRKLRKIKVIYRASLFKELVVDAKKQLKRENISLHSVNVETPDSSDMNAKIKEEISKLDGYDALWIMLDSSLLTKENFSQVWIKGARSAEIPFLCGVEKFALPPINLCPFAAYPNTRGLASHVAEIALSILDGDAVASDYGVEYLTSSDKIINLPSLKRFGLSISNSKLDNLRIYDE